MKKIIDHRKLFDVSHDADLNTLKTIYRNLIKEWHPDKFQDSDELKAEAEAKSKTIIEAYHFLVSIAPETHTLNAEVYNNTINKFGIEDFEYKGQTLKVTFQDGSIYEYFNVPKNIYSKLINAPAQSRFARRHIFTTYLHRNVSRSAIAV